MHPGDVFAINDPYAGGTHFSDVRLIRPIFADGKIIAFSQSNGHWSDVGGSVPGSFDVAAREMFREGLRITPVRLFDKGRFCKDVAHLIASNTRDPASIIGDIHAQAQATQVCEREILRLVGKYGRETVETGLAEVQDYVERAMRQRLAALPDGVWETQDFIDRDPAGSEGMIPIKVKITIKGDKAIYDFTGSHPTIGSIYNSAFGTTFSAVAAGMKTFFPDLPLNSGFYRVLEIIAPEGSIVDARWPVGVTGFLMPFEKIMNAIYEIWSKIMPQRALACAFNLEYLLTGGLDARRPDKPIFMFYDWLPGGWGGRNGKRRLQRHDRLLRHRPDGATGRRPGARQSDPDHRVRNPQGFRRARQMARRGRRAQDIDHARGREDCHFLYLRPRTGDRLGHRGRSAVDAAWAEHQARRSGQGGLAGFGVFRRADRLRRCLQPPDRRRRRLRRPAGARSGAGARRRDRRLCLDRARRHGLWCRHQADRCGNLRLSDR